MKVIHIGQILSITVPGDAALEKLADGDTTLVVLGHPQESMRLVLFQDVEGSKTAWCEKVLEEHGRDVIGPPFDTRVEEIDGDTWSGLQGVTLLDEGRWVVNRVIASKVSGYGARVEFEMVNAVPERVVGVAESLAFMGRGDVASCSEGLSV